MPGQHIPLFFQAGAGMSVALAISVKLASDPVAVRRAPRLLAADRAVHARPRRVGTRPVSCQEPSRSPAADPDRDESTRAADDAVITARPEYRRNSGEAIKRRRGSRPVARSDVVVELELVRVRAQPEFVELGGPLVIQPGLDQVLGEHAA